MALPMLLREMVNFIQDPTAPAIDGIVIALLMFAGNLGQCYITHKPMVESGNIGTKLRACMMVSTVTERAGNEHHWPCNIGGLQSRRQSRLQSDAITKRTIVFAAEE